MASAYAAKVSQRVKLTKKKEKEKKERRLLEIEMI